MPKQAVRQLPKAITEEGLQKDLEYVLGGIDCHEVLASICPPRPGLKVLEPGCGSGKLGIWYALRGAFVTLMDIDGQAVEYAQQLAQLAQLRGSTGLPGLHIEYCVGSIHKMPSYWSNTFDFVFNEGVPQHWGYYPKDWRRQHAINHMVRVTKPRGHVCVIGTNGHCPQAIHMVETTAHTYRGMPPRQKPWTRVELVDRLVKAGLTDVGVCPVSSIEWSDSMLLAGWGRKL